MNPDPLALSIIESVLLEEMGLSISSLGKNSIKKALSRRMSTLSSENFYTYLSLLKKSSVELNAFIDEVAINETWFYRDEAPFNALSKYALTILNQSPDKPIRLLSVPCSTGEEPYSMAISLLEAGFNERQYSIDAVDISSRSLTIAQDGVYRKNSFRGHASRFQKRYFDAVSEETYAIKNNVKKNVNFIKGNLLTLVLPSASIPYDVIFCRNLFIYLDSRFHNKVIHIVSGLLQDDGILFVGHSESGLFSASQFKPAPGPNTFSFFKNKQPLETAQPDHGHNREAKAEFPHDLEADTGKTISPFSPQNQSVSVSEAKLSTENGDYGKAISIYKNIIQEKGPSARIFFLLAINFYEIAEFTNCITLLKKAIYLDPDLIEAIDLLARIYKEFGDEQNFQSFSRRCKRVQRRLRLVNEL
jgi:chemotaxis protein methyltransferase WspC